MFHRRGLFSLFLSRGGRKGKETGYKTSHLVQLTVFLSNGSGGFFIYGENVVGRGREEKEEKEEEEEEEEEEGLFSSLSHRITRRRRRLAHTSFLLHFFLLPLAPQGL